MKLKSLKEIIEEKNVCLIVYHFEIYFTKQFQLVCQRIMLLSITIYTHIFDFIETFTKLLIKKQQLYIKKYLPV